MKKYLAFMLTLSTVITGNVLSANANEQVVNPQITDAAIVNAANQPQIKEINLILKNHVFIPNTLELEAGIKYLIALDNKDNSAEEFHSDDLKIKQFVNAKSKANIDIGPLKP